jgi:hypothetical protein
MIFSKPLYYITKVRDHHKNKEKILWAISTVNGRNYDDGISKISNTDWPSQQERVNFDWYNYSLSERDRNSYTRLIYKKFGKDTCSIKSIWYNQYDPHSGTEHTWHSHNLSLASIYYVELKDKSLRTILEHPKTGKEIVPRVNEGEILTFDPGIKHMSPPNYTDTRKTIIAFNVLFLK